MHAELDTDQSRADRALYEKLIANVLPPVDGQLPRRLGAAARLGGMMGTVGSRFATAWFAFLVVFFLVLTFGFAELMGEFWLPMLFLLLFVAAGAAVLVIGIRKGLRDIRLMRNGLLTWAVVTNVEHQVSTSTDSDGRTSTSVSYDVHFLYGTQAGEVLRGMTNMGRADAVTDEPLELLVYDPANPYDCQFADTLSGGLRLSADGVASAQGVGTAMGIVQACMLGLSFLVILASYATLLFAESKPRDLPAFNRERLEPPSTPR